MNKYWFLLNFNHTYLLRFQKPVLNFTVAQLNTVKPCAITNQGYNGPLATTYYNEILGRCVENSLFRGFRLYLKDEKSKCIKKG